MSEKANVPQNDLTSTIHLSTLKALSPHLSAVVENLSAEDRSVLSQLPLGAGMLVVQTGPGRGSRFLIDHGLTEIGRNTESDICLDDVTVSRKHAVITTHIRNDKTFFTLKDEGSLNGTYVDGIRAESVELANGNEIHIGKYKMIFFANNGDLVKILTK